MTKSDCISPKLHSVTSFQTTGFPIWLWFDSIKDLGGNVCLFIEKRIPTDSLQTTLNIPIIALDRIYSGTLIMAEYIPSNNLIVVDDIWIFNNTLLNKPYKTRYELLKTITSDIISYIDGLSWAKIILKPLNIDEAECPYEAKGIEYRNPSGMLTETIWFEPKLKNPTFLLKRTNMFDVWEVFDDKKSLGFAAIQTMELSEKLAEIKDKTIKVECVWLPEFNKWMPLL